jgi:hypothetical protein
MTGIGLEIPDRVPSPTREDMYLELKTRLCSAKYCSLFVRKYRQKYRQLRTYLHRQL